MCLPGSRAHSDSARKAATEGAQDSPGEARRWLRAQAAISHWEGAGLGSQRAGPGSAMPCEPVWEAGSQSLRLAGWSLFSHL